MNSIQPLVDIIKMHNKQYVSFGDYSATDIISPYRKTILSKRHGGQLEQTIEGSVASFVGSGVHNYAEHLLRLSNSDRYVLERSVFNQLNGKLITGRFDILMDGKHMYDIKTCKTWKTIFDPDMVEWHEQQNIYAYLLHTRGIEIESLNIMAIYLDWIESQATRNPNSYPSAPVVQYELDLWDPAKTEAYITHRIEVLSACENVADDILPTCSREERWERFPNGVTVQYAVMKNPTAKRATRVCATLDEAAEYCQKSKALSSESFVEVRYAKRKRCQKYCNVAPMCNHYQEYKEKLRSNTLNEIIPMNEIWGI